MQNSLSKESRDYLFSFFSCHKNRGNSTGLANAICIAYGSALKHSKYSTKNEESITHPSECSTAVILRQSMTRYDKFLEILRARENSRFHPPSSFIPLTS